MTDKEEVIWAKLNGNWDNSAYRMSLVEHGKCLHTLATDINTPVKTAAITKIITGVILDIVPKVKIDE